MLPREQALETFWGKIPISCDMLQKSLNTNDVRRIKASYHFQKQDFALLGKYDQILEQNKHGQSLTDAIKLPFLSLFSGKIKSLIQKSC